MPRAIVVSWVLSVLVGGTVVGVAVARPEPQPRTLSPRTAARYLAEIVPAPRDAVRVNGIYGSGHTGAWQFVAHVTWRTPSGDVEGGVTNLPVLAGAPPVESPVDRSRFPGEHEIGWTFDQLGDVLASLDDTDDDLAMLELEITTTRDSLIACHARRSDAAGRCAEYDRGGRRLRSFESLLTDTPLGDALAVQRA